METLHVMMKKYLFFGIACVVFLSCDKDDTLPLLAETGTIWRSGGLYYCAEQIHLDNGDIVIVADLTSMLEYPSGTRVSVAYQKLGMNKNCAPAIDGEIIEIEEIE